MGQLYYQENSGQKEQAISMDDKTYREPNSVHISEDWDTIMEDFIDDFDDFQDFNIPRSDEDY